MCILSRSGSGGAHACAYVDVSGGVSARRFGVREGKWPFNGMLF